MCLNIKAHIKLRGNVGSVKEKWLKRSEEILPYSRKPYLQSKYWKSGQSSVCFFLPLKLQSSSQSSEWKTKIVNNHSSVMGKPKPLLNLLNHSIIPPKRPTRIAKGEGNEWNWSNLAIWK